MTAERIAPAGHASTARLVNDAATQVSRLVHDEIALAKLEMRSKAKKGGVAGALLASALLLAAAGLVLAWVLLIVALANVWPLWLAVIVPMGGAFVVAGLLALVGKRHLAAASPPMPTETTKSVRADLQLAQSAVHEGRRS